MSQDHITKLYNAQGALIGVLLSPEAWSVAAPALEAACGEPEKPTEPSERLSDWETLKQYWDFPYPVDTDVCCEACGSCTQDFLSDEPRKFLLTSASLSGLVSYYCRECKAKVVKRHFKDEITSETMPFQSDKDPRKEAKYGS